MNIIYLHAQVTLAAQDKFVSFLCCVLDVLSHFLEVSSFTDIGKVQYCLQC